VVVLQEIKIEPDFAERITIPRLKKETAGISEDLRLNKPRVMDFGRKLFYKQRGACLPARISWSLSDPSPLRFGCAYRSERSLEPNNGELSHTKSGANPAVRKCRSVVAASRIPRCFMQAKLVQSVKENAWSS